MDSNLHTLKYILKEALEQPAVPAVQVPLPSQLPADISKPKKKKKKVIFDKSSTPWEVIFTERGFLVEETRLSFEEIENAINKNYSIILKDGKGLNLDAVKMQKILKYKES